MSRCWAPAPAGGPRPASLSALQQYGDSDSEPDSDMEVDVERLADKRRAEDAAPAPSKRARPALPLPAAVQQMFGGGGHEDRPEQHQGRVRTFGHVRGNWATYVFVRWEVTPAFESLVQTCLVICEPQARLTAQQECHVSLTRTVVLKHHWIESFRQSVRKALETFKSFQLSVGPARVYVNDERTRTFLGLTVAVGRETVAELSSKMDRCLAEYGLPPFYEEGSFHLSVAWCVGDCSAALERLLPELDTAVAGYASQGPLVRDVTEVHCRCGDRRFEMPLAAR